MNQTDEQGQITASYTYDPYGKMTSKQGSIDTIFKYSGKYGVSEEPNNLLYMRSRYYQVEIGRFITADSYEGNKLNILSQNRYTYVEGNPINYIDPLGLEKVIVVGGITQTDYKKSGERYEKYKYQFMEAAIHDIKEQRRKELQEYWEKAKKPLIGATKGDSWDLMIKKSMYNKYKEESIALLVVNYGYTPEEMQEFEKVAKMYNVEFVKINKIQDFVNYVNTKDVTGKNNTRAQDKITYFSSFSHGVSGELAWGYNRVGTKRYEEGKKLNFLIEDIEKLDSKAFSEKIYSISYACNTGTAHNGGDSFAQAWANKTNGIMKAVVDGKTDYTYINVPKNPMKYPEKYSYAIDRYLITKTFSYEGSVKYPDIEKDVYYQEFYPRNGR